MNDFISDEFAQELKGADKIFNERLIEYANKCFTAPKTVKWAKPKKLKLTEKGARL